MARDGVSTGGEIHGLRLPAIRRTALAAKMPHVGRIAGYPVQAIFNV
jgi:hypothetical protein